MKMTNKRIIKVLSVLLVFTLFIGQYAISGGLYAKADSLAIQSGENWLKANQQSEGYWGTNSYSGIIDTSEILNYFKKNGHASGKVETAEKWLNSQEGKNLDYEAKMLPYITDNTKHESILSDLTSKQNDDGGWGAAGSYKSDALDTMVVLSALMKETSQNTSAEQKAVGCLISQQNSDGGWSYISGDTSNISLTSQILMTLYDYSQTNTSTELANALSSAKKFLVSDQHTDKTWGTDESSIDDTLYAYQALIKTSDGKSVAGISDIIVGLQKSDGSWNDNAYTTILALEALSEPAQNAPVINSIKIYKIDNDSKTESTNFGQNDSGEVDVDASFDSSAYSLSVSIKSHDGSITQLSGSNNEYKFSIGSAYSGDYTIKACVKDASGNIVTEQDKMFSVTGAESISDLKLYKIKDGSATECYSFNQNEDIGIAFTSKYDSLNESISVSVKKPDGTEVTVSGTGSYTWNAAKNDAGNYSVIVRVLDKSGQTIAKEDKAFTIQVPIQTATINSIKLYRLIKGTQTETSTFDQNESVNISVDATYDSNSETMDVSVKKPDETVETCANNNGYSWNTGNNTAGEYTVIVKIYDINGKIIATQEKILNITVAKANESVSALKLYKIQNGISTECDSFKQNENVGISFTSTYNQDTNASTFNGHTYKLYESNDNMTWEKAEEYCKKMGGHLATITSQPEQSFIESLLQHGTKNSYWLGATRSESNWTWVTGEPFTYTNWASGQPDNCNGNENCLMIYKNINPMSDSNIYTWNDLKEDCTCGNENFFGSDNFGFICEWDKTLTVSVKKPDGTIETCMNNNGYSWNTESNAAGSYTVIVQINDSNGNVIAQDEKAFTIEQSQMAKINSVKIVNSTQEETAAFGQNEYVGAIVDATYDSTKDSLAVSVKKPDGTAEIISDVNGYEWNTGSNKPGNYSVVVQLKDSTGNIVDESDKSFTINNSFSINSINVTTDAQSTTVGIEKDVNILVPVTYVTNADKTVIVNVSVYDASGNSVFSSNQNLICAYGQNQSTAGPLKFTPNVSSPQTYTIKANVMDGNVQIGSAQSTFDVQANQTTNFPYVIFAGGDGNSLNFSHSNVTVNGNLHSNGSIQLEGNIANINGSCAAVNGVSKGQGSYNIGKVDNNTAMENTIVIDNKIMSTYFNSNCNNINSPYTVNDVNVNINSPIYDTESINLTGNVSCNNSIGSNSNISISGNTLNLNSSVLYSKNGNITIDNDNSNVNGIIYCPNGKLVIHGTNFHCNGIIIAKEIVIDASTVNIDYNDSLAAFVGTASSNSNYTSTVIGTITNTAGQPLENVNVTLYKYNQNNGNYENANISAITNSSGEFKISLDKGQYDFKFAKSGYIPLDVYSTIEPNTTTYLEKSLMVNSSYLNTAANVSGTVTDSVTGCTIEGATVKYRNGWNTISGDYIKDSSGNAIATTSDYNGNYKSNLSAGNYTAEISKDGYITGYFNIVCSPDYSQNLNAALSPVLADGDYRIVLTWGSIPSDLDSHLTGPTTSGRFHVDYITKTYTDQNNNNIAQLDLDDTSSYGPETITLKLNLGLQGVYRYSVHDYTDKYSSNSQALSLSGAQVKIYRGNTLLKTYSVPENTPGTLWSVFEINNGQINTINQMSFASDPSSIQ